MASAIPQVQTVAGLIAAVCIMQFTYTFPPLLWLGYQVRIYGGGHNPAAANSGSDPVTDPDASSLSWSRYRKGFFGGKWHYNIFNLVLFLGSAAMACLGTRHLNDFTRPKAYV